MENNINTFQIRKAIENLVDASRHQTLKELNAIKHIGIDSEKNVVILIIEVGMLNGENEKKLRRDLARIIKIDLNFKGIKIQFQEERNFQNVSNKNTKFIIVTSGKGGVGKSSVSCNLAYHLTKLGKKVGLIDADIYGSSVPKILEMPHSEAEVTLNGKIVPFKAFGIEMISTEFFSDEGRPIIWRGAILNNMINNFFFQVNWSKDLEYMIIDAPPGTGDVMLDLSKTLPNAEVLMVTTPHPSAAFVATKAGIAAKEMKHNIIGVVENMSYYINPLNKQKEYIFGRGGAEEVAKKLDSEVIASIPISNPSHHLSIYEDDEDAGKAYKDLALLISIRD